MTNEIQVFNFEQSNIRTFVDENGTPWFCAKDVCDVLGYIRSRDAVNQHCKIEGVAKHRLVKTLSNGREQEFEQTFIDERNLYRLIMRSKLESAEKFQDWVCGEVIPSIRKTGSYLVPKLRPMFEATGELGRQVEAHFILAQYMVDKEHVTLPVAKAYALDAIHVDTGLTTDIYRKLLPSIQPKDQAYLNATQIGQKVGLSAVSVNKRLAELNLIKKVGKNWVLTEEGTKHGEAKPYSRHGHSGYDVKWRESVLTLFANNKQEN